MVEETTIQLPRLECFSCGYLWFPRRPENPVACPNCGSRSWDVPKKSTEEPEPAARGAGENPKRETWILQKRRVGRARRIRHDSLRGAVVHVGPRGPPTRQAGP